MKAWLFMITLCMLLFTSLVHVLSYDPLISTAEASSLPKTVHVTVQTGDTLWGIAAQYNKANHVSVTDMIAVIIEENHIQKSTIRPGEVLSIPIKK